MLKILYKILVVLLISLSLLSSPIHAADSSLAAFESAGVITYIDLGTSRLDINNRQYVITDDTKVRSLRGAETSSIYQYPLEKGMSINFISIKQDREKPEVITEIMIIDKSAR